MSLHVQVVTPEKTVLETEADEIIIPTTEGEIAVLPHHVALLTQVAPGELMIKKNQQTQHMAVMGGFVEISKDSVSILAEFAVAGKDISALKAQEAKDRAEKAMKENLSQEDYAVAAGELQKAILQLKIAGKLHRRTTPLPSENG